MVGLSILSGSHLELIPEVVRLLRDEGVDVPVVVGGIIPPADAERLREAGVAGVYTPKDFDINRIMGEIVELVAERAAPAPAPRRRPRSRWQRRPVPATRSAVMPAIAHPVFGEGDLDLSSGAGFVSNISMTGRCRRCHLRRGLVRRGCDVRQARHRPLGSGGRRRRSNIAWTMCRR